MFFLICFMLDAKMILHNDAFDAGSTVAVVVAASVVAVVDASVVATVVSERISVNRHNTVELSPQKI